MTFDINQAVAQWKKELRRQQSLEPGFIEELESGLYDRYDEFLIRGMEPEQAFEQAVAKVSPQVSATSVEYAKVTRRTRSSWLSGFMALQYLLPNYLKMGLRKLRRNKFYHAINYTCLVVGILTTTLALLYLDYETSYDEFVAEAGQKYRLGRTFRSQDYSVMSFDGYYNATPASQMKQIDGIRAVDGVEAACHFYTFGEPEYVVIDEQKLATEDLLETNTPGDFFTFFGWTFIRGAEESFSSRLNTAVLTAQQAERFFGKDWERQDILGKKLEIGEEVYSIEGVIEDIPPNAHFTFSIALHRDKIDYWGSRTYIKIGKGESPEVIEARLDENIGSINADIAGSELFGGTILQNITDIHLHSDMLYELKPPGDKRYLYIIGIISGIILLLTISNYTNLSIAMNAGRAREIGMRKVFGAQVSQVSSQFVLESMLLALLSLPVVFLGLQLIIPVFNNLMDTGLEEQVFTTPSVGLLIIGVACLVGFLSSLYPALFLAKHRIVKLFQGNLVKHNLSGFSTRKAIITFQFVLLIGLCSLTLLVNQQLRFIQKKDLGYDKNQVLYVNLAEDSTKYALFRQEMMQLPGVYGVGSGSPLGGTPYNQTTYRMEGTSDIYDDAYNIYLEYNTLKLLNIKTSISEWIERPEDAPKSAVLINETLAARLTAAYGLSRAELMGKSITEEPEYTDEETGQIGFPFIIAGTFEDINMFSLREKMTPIFLTAYRDPGFVQWASIGFEGVNPSEILQRVKEKYQELLPDKAFVYSFLSENIEELYEKEKRIASLSIFFSLIAFLVAIIGLIALTAFLTALKQKDIGVRRLLGASQLDILKRYNKEYLYLILIALLIAAPLTYLGASNWLSGFAYRIHINPAVFFTAGIITLTIACAAVSVITFRAATSIPVEALHENQ